MLDLGVKMGLCFYRSSFRIGSGVMKSFVLKGDICQGKNQKELYTSADSYLQADINCIVAKFVRGNQIIGSVNGNHSR